MNERRAFILELVTERYIRSAKPVPSSFIAKRLEVSSATVRNEFSALEADGYLQQPHTSAGRTPTTKGFKHYVAKFIPPKALSEAQQLHLVERFQGSHGETLLQRVATVTAELSGYAVVVSWPGDEHMQALEIHLSALSSTRLLVVVVLENGLIRQFALDFDPAPSDEVLRDAESNLRQLTLPVSELPKALLDIASRSDEELARTLRALAGAWPELSPPKLFSKGLSNLFSEPEANDPQFVRMVVESVEQPAPLDDSSEALIILLDEDLARIGARLALGSSRGQLTVVGPTRMRYPEALTIAKGVIDTVAHAV